MKTHDKFHALIFLDEKLDRYFMVLNARHFGLYLTVLSGNEKNVVGMGSFKVFRLVLICNRNSSTHRFTIVSTDVFSDTKFNHLKTSVCLYVYRFRIKFSS